MTQINFQEFYNKNDAVNACSKNNTTVRQECIKKFELIINALTICKNKLNNGESLQNEDFVKAAKPLRSMMNAIMNRWYEEN